jgi:hypothetical protein
MSDVGGEENASEGEIALVRRAAALRVELEYMEVKLARAETGGAPKLIDLYGRTTNTLRRLLETLAAGLQRRARDITPPLDVYLNDPGKEGQ